MKRLPKTLAAFFTIWIFPGCRDNPPVNNTYSQKSEVAISGGYVARGFVEEIDFGNGINVYAWERPGIFMPKAGLRRIELKGRMMSVFTEHGSRVYVQDGTFICWEHLGTWYLNQFESFKGNEYPAWDIYGFREFMDD